MTEGLWEETSEASNAGTPPPGKVRRHLHLWIAAGLGLTVLLGLAAQNIIGRVRAATRPSESFASTIVLGQPPALQALQQELVHEQLADPGPPPPINEAKPNQAAQDEAARHQAMLDAEAQRQAQIAASPILALSHLPAQAVPLAHGAPSPSDPTAVTPAATGSPSLGMAFNTPLTLPNWGNTPWNPSPALPSMAPSPASPSARSQHNTTPLEPNAPASNLLILEGTVISAVLITQINSDLPGLITAQVTEDVYDSLQGNVLVIPKGSRVIGSFGAHILPGQERLMASFHRLILPSGVSFDLDETSASDASGQAGMQDEVDNRFWKRLGGQFMTAGLARVIQQPSGGVTVLGGMGNNLTTDAAGQILVNTASIGFAADAAIGPVIIIKKGYPFTLLVNRDMDFAQPPH